MYTSSAAINLFITKRRRAYVACANCRKRITISEVDYSQCTQCSLKGLKCEYSAVPGSSLPSSQPGTFPGIEVPTTAGDYPHVDGTPQPITPPSAGITEYLGSKPSSKGARPAAAVALPSCGAPRYPYQRRRASPPAPTLKMPPTPQVPQPTSSYAEAASFPLTDSEICQDYWAYFPGAPDDLVDPTAGYGNHYVYDQNCDQLYMPHGSSNELVCPWPEAIAFAHHPVYVAAAQTSTLEKLVGFLSVADSYLFLPTEHTSQVYLYLAPLY
ncbi:hypothetical protein C8R47DRAFT_1327098 [Mycena vitilis]|nr:hypothetical protein C8R47DRAFT_1327098 [Mycena vitilis]